MIKGMILKEVRFIFEILFIGGIFVSPSYAFDPLTIMGIVKGGMDVTSEITDTVDGATELSQELGVEADFVPEEDKKLLREIEEMKSLATEAGYTVDEVNALSDGDQRDVEKLSGVLKRMTSIVRAGKRVQNLFSKIERKAQIAEIESSKTEKEILKTQYIKIAHEKHQEIEEKKDKLKPIVERKRWVEAKESEIEKSGGFKWGKIGIYSFPEIDPVFEKTFKVYHQYKKWAMGLLLLTFMLRTALLNASCSEIAKYSDLFSSLFLCGLWLCIAPLLIEVILSESHVLAKSVKVSASISGGPSSQVHQPSGWMDLYQYNSWIFSQIKIYAFQITDFLFTIVLAVLIAVAPIVIFSSTMMKTGMGLKRFFSIFIILAMWPLIWNLVGSIAKELLSPEKLGSRDSIYSVALSIFQVFSPYLGFYLLQGSAIGQSMTKTFGAAVTTPYQAFGFSQALKNRPGGGGGGQRVGQGIKHFAQGTYSLGTQVLQRSQSGLKRMNSSQNKTSPEMRHFYKYYSGGRK